MADLDTIRRDLALEHDDLDAIVSDLADDEWDTMTPAHPWTIRHQIAHLAFFDERAAQAAGDPQAFAESLTRVADLDEYVNGPARRADALSPADVLAWWRTARADMMASFASFDPSVRVPWYGPPMSPASFMSARLMETWAHGQDVVDGSGRRRVATDRLVHVAFLGYRARRNSYVAHGLEMPEEDVLVELRSPSGETWTFGRSTADRIAGTAEDFCLVVTQRRHPEDTFLTIEGPLAREWMQIAQAFAGPPGEGRRPGQFARSQG